MDTVLEKKIEDAVTLAYDTGVFAGRNGNGSLKSWAVDNAVSTIIYWVVMDYEKQKANH